LKFTSLIAERKKLSSEQNLQFIASEGFYSKTLSVFRE